MSFLLQCDIFFYSETSFVFLKHQFCTQTQQEQCERLSKKVEDLQKQNLTLTSFIVSKGRFQSLNNRRKPNFLPVSLALTNSNSQSLPNTLIKAKVSWCT